MKRVFLLLVVVVLFSALVDIPHIIQVQHVAAAEAASVNSAQVGDPSLVDFLNWSELLNTVGTSGVLLALLWLLWRRNISQQELIEQTNQDAQAKYDQLVMLLLQTYLGKPVSPLATRTGMEEFLTHGIGGVDET